MTNEFVKAVLLTLMGGALLVGSGAVFLAVVEVDESLSEIWTAVRNWLSGALNGGWE